MAEASAVEPAGSKLERRRFAMFAVAMVLWLGGFVFVRVQGNWTPFALFGVTLVAIAIASDARVRELLHPRWIHVAAGGVVGVTMVLLTHGAFEVVSDALPIARQSTWRLFTLLDVVGFTPAQRAGLIVVIAACEEVIFRGALLGPAGHSSGDPWHRIDRRDLLHVLGWAVAYALATATLGSWLLVLCAWCCGVLWGLLRIVTRSLVAPIIAHVAWDLGVLVLWPLVFAEM
ncbi:MAG: CPBP family intramembrane metalloprotease [Deltaproteobacteria bacterium]|nr:CPBP family intramembrane metalloprotease [Nannocystaceae bacterium]